MTSPQHPEPAPSEAEPSGPTASLSPHTSEFGTRARFGTTAAPNRTTRDPHRSEALAGVAGLRVGALAAGGRVGRREVRAELDGGDVVDPGPAQPTVEVGHLEVDAEGGRPPGPVH